MKKKKQHARPPIRAEKVKQLIMLDPTRSMRSILLEAGYCHNSAEHPSKFFATIEGEELLKWIKGETKEIQKQMKKTRKDARYKELADTLIGIQKMANLNKGMATENVQITLEDLLRRDKED